jgi:hypothetical protein
MAGKDRFETVTGVQTTNMIGYAITGAVLVLLSLFGLLVTVGLFIVLAAVAVTSAAMLIVFQLTIKWKIVFENDQMYAENVSTHQIKNIGRLRLSDLEIRDTNKEKDTGKLFTPYPDCRYENVKNFAALKEYLNTHLQP